MLDRNTDHISTNKKLIHHQESSHKDIENRSNYDNYDNYKNIVYLKQEANKAIIVNSFDSCNRKINKHISNFERNIDDKIRNLDLVLSEMSLSIDNQIKNSRLKEIKAETCFLTGKSNNSRDCNDCSNTNNAYSTNRASLSTNNTSSLIDVSNLDTIINYFEDRKCSLLKEFTNKGHLKQSNINNHSCFESYKKGLLLGNGVKRRSLFSEIKQPNGLFYLESFEKKNLKELEANHDNHGSDNGNVYLDNNYTTNKKKKQSCITEQYSKEEDNLRLSNSNVSDCIEEVCNNDNKKNRSLVTDTTTNTHDQIKNIRTTLNELSKAGKFSNNKFSIFNSNNNNNLGATPCFNRLVNNNDNNLNRYDFTFVKRSLSMNGMRNKFLYTIGKNLTFSKNENMVNKTIEKKSVNSNIGNRDDCFSKTRNITSKVTDDKQVSFGNDNHDYVENDINNNLSDDTIKNSKNKAVIDNNNNRILETTTRQDIGAAMVCDASIKSTSNFCIKNSKDVNSNESNRDNIMKSMQELLTKGLVISNSNSNSNKNNINKENNNDNDNMNDECFKDTNYNIRNNVKDNRIDNTLNNRNNSFNKNTNDERIRNSYNIIKDKISSNYNTSNINAKNNNNNNTNFNKSFNSNLTLSINKQNNKNNNNNKYSYANNNKSFIEDKNAFANSLVNILNKTVIDDTITESMLNHNETKTNIDVNNINNNNLINSNNTVKNSKIIENMLQTESKNKYISENTMQNTNSVNINKQEYNIKSNTNNNINIYLNNLSNKVNNNNSNNNNIQDIKFNFNNKMENSNNNSNNSSTFNYMNSTTTNNNINKAYNNNNNNITTCIQEVSSSYNIGYQITDESDINSDDDDEVVNSKFIPEWANDKSYIRKAVETQIANNTINRVFKREKIENFDLGIIFSNIKIMTRGDSADWRLDNTISSKAIKMRLFNN